MLLLTCMIMLCIVLDTYAQAQKHSSDKVLDNSQPSVIVNTKNENLRSNPLIITAPPPLLQFAIPTLIALNPFQTKQQILGTKDASDQLAEWLQPFYSNLLRPLSLSDTLLSTLQTYPVTANLTHLGDFGKSMDSNSFLLKLLNQNKENQERTKNDGFQTTTPNDITISEESSKDDISKITFVISTTDSAPLDANVTDEKETITNYYDDDSLSGKIPQLEESDEISTKSDSSSSNSNLQNESNDSFWKNFLHINKTANTTQNSISDLKQVVTTLNLSQAQAAAFVKIIEKIVEEELKRRRIEEISKSELIATSEKPKLAAAKLDSQSTGTGEYHEEEIRPSENDDDQKEEIRSPENRDRYQGDIRPHEKLTANTRLSFDDHIDYYNSPGEISETLSAQPMKSDSRKEVRKRIDYMTREQAEYDRLVSGITAAAPQAESDYLEISTDEGDSQEFRRSTVKSTIVEKPRIRSLTRLQPVKAEIQFSKQPYTSSPPTRKVTIYGKVTSIPRTVFERQAKDFRSRLLGMNGVNDIVKALKHAKIGFFKRN